MGSPVPSPPNSPSDDTNSLFKMILDNLLDGVYFTDLERRITYWNQAAEDITGYSAKEVLGKHCADNILMHVDDSGCVLCMGECPLSRAIAENRPLRSDIYVHHKSGHRIPVETRVCPITQDGKVVGAVEIFSDNSRQWAVRERVTSLQSWHFWIRIPSGKPSLLGPTTFSATRPIFQVRHSVRNLIGRRGQVQEHQRYLRACRRGCGAGHCRQDSVRLFACLRRTGTLGRRRIVGDSPRHHGKHAGGHGREVQGAGRPVYSTSGRLQIQLTISVGAAMVAPGDSAESLLNRADQHLYSFKEPGGSRESL